MAIHYVLALVISRELHALLPCLALVCLGIYYNNMGGADRSFIIRNLVNGAGYVSFAMGAYKVASRAEPNMTGQEIFHIHLLVGAIIATTVQIQDFQDQEGDRARNRKTMPIVLGDHKARWLTALTVTFWGCFSPSLFSLGVAFRVFGGLMAAMISWRLVTRRTGIEDEKTFVLWNVWLAWTFCMPLLRACESIIE